MQLRHALVIKGNLAADQDVQHNAKAPHVNLWANVCLGLEQFGCGKVERAAKGFEKTLRRKGVAETKVNNLDITSLTDEDVFDFQITMNDAISVAIVKGACNLATEFASLLLLEAAMGDDVVKHLATVDIFEEHIPVVVGPEYVAHAANVRVVDKGNDGSLTGSTDFLRVVCSLPLLGRAVLISGLTRNYFHGDLESCQHTRNAKQPRDGDESTHLFASLFVPCKLDLAHATCTDSLAKLPVSRRGIYGCPPTHTRTSSVGSGVILGGAAVCG